MLYILHGEEEFLRSEEIAKLKAHITSGGLGDLNLAILDGRKVSLGDLVNACNTLPFLGDKRMVIVENLLQRFEAREKNKAGETAIPSTNESDYAKQLAAYLPNLPPSTRLLLVENKTVGRSNPILKQAQQLGKEAYIREFGALRDEDLQDWIQKRAKSKGSSIAREATSLLAQFVGSDLRLLDQELEKLAAFSNYTRLISTEDVKALVSAAREADIFAFVDSLGLRDRERAMQQLQNLIASGENELYILTMIARQFRLILSAKDLAQERDLKAEEIGRELRIQHRFIVDKLLRQAQQFSLGELEAIQRRILETDQALKTGRIEGPLALELFVVDICRPTRGSSHDYQGKNRARTR
jgi:DNA polymerase III subunit delta